MSIDEAILYMVLYRQKLVGSVSDLDKDIEAYDMAIRALKQYGVLQEIQQDIEEAKLPNDDEICKANNYGLNTALVIIDKHIAESEG